MAAAAEDGPQRGGAYRCCAAACVRSTTPVPSWLQWRAWPAAPVRTLPNKWRPWEKPVCRSKPHPLGGVTRCGRSQERLIWVGALVGIGFHPIIPSKGRKWCIEQRWEPNRQQSQWEAAVNPELAVVERADNAEVAFVMHHHQIEEERQEQKVGEDVHYQAVLEIQLWSRVMRGMKGRVMPVHKSATSRLKKK